MPIYFAASRRPAASPVTRVLVKLRTPQAANDEAADPLADAVIRDALLHFAEHGLGAAGAAQARSARAFASGDDTAGQRWRAICALFDRRLAAGLQRSTQQTG